MNTPAETQVPAAPDPTPYPTAPKPIEPAAAQEPNQPPEEDALAVTPPKKDQISINSVLGVVDVLSEADQIEFYACEAVLEMDQQSFVEKGRALGTIREKRLYRGG